MNNIGVEVITNNETSYGKTQKTIGYTVITPSIFRV
jgi:hypothetical protein